MDDGEQRALRERCTRFLHHHGKVTAADMLGAIPPDTDLDRYGDLGVVAKLESEIATVLGKPAAVFFPSGTMAQQVTLRMHADRRASRTVVYHPTCHLQLHEDAALERIQGLIGCPVGSATRLLTLDQLNKVAEPVAALLLELPQREIGGQQPDWDDLVAQVAWARDRDAAAHLDGARLWESAAGYGKSLAEIAALFDTVYVSFYKGIGALPGCCVAGSAADVAELRDWRKRMGGTLFALWPNAASALTNLRLRLPRMATYLQHARAIAAALAEVQGVTVIPDPPQVSMMHLHLRVTADVFEAKARRIAEEQAIWTWPEAMTTVDPAVQKVELAVGDATCEWEPKEIADVIAQLVAG